MTSPYNDSMKHSLLALILVVAALPAAEPEQRWLDSYDQAVAAATAANKPIFLVFRCER